MHSKLQVGQLEFARRLSASRPSGRVQEQFHMRPRAFFFGQFSLEYLQQRFAIADFPSVRRNAREREKLRMYGEMLVLLVFQNFPEHSVGIFLRWP